MEKNNHLSEKEADLTRKIENNIETVEEKVKMNTRLVNNVMESVHKQKSSIEDIAELSERLYKSAGSLSQLFEASDAAYFENGGIIGADAQRYAEACKQIILCGDEYISPVYISAITKKPCVTFSAPIRNHGGKIVGVVGKGGKDNHPNVFPSPCLPSGLAVINSNTRYNRQGP